MWDLLLGLLLTVLPVFELRGGLPLVLNYALSNNFAIFPFFILVLFLNIFVAYLLFLFLDFFHEKLLRFNFYKKGFAVFLKRVRKKESGFEKRFEKIGYLALMLFVAIPLPGSGVWTGVLLAWFFGLKRSRSFIAISLGTIIAGFFVLMFSLGFFNLIY